MVELYQERRFFLENQGDRLSLRSNFRFAAAATTVVCWLALLLAVGGLFGLTGCSSVPKEVQLAREQVQTAYEMNKPVVMRTSKDDNRPAWTKETVYEDGGKVYFSGAFLNGSDYSVTVRCANSEALKVAAQEISQFIRVEFSSYAQGENVGAGGIDRYVSDGIAVFVRNLHMQGVRQREVYYEEVMSASVMQPTYNIWVRLEMSKADYLRAKADVLRKLRDKFNDAGQVEAKEKAQRLLDKLKQGVDVGSRADRDVGSGTRARGAYGTV